MRVTTRRASERNYDVMAESEREASDPWRYCVVCRRHHEQGRKHIFTTKHKTKLNAIITKFAEKVRCARQQLQKPGVMEGELEPDASLWCYFCELEVMRHVTDSLTTVVWGGLLEHMASVPHHKKTRQFWWMNGADKKHLQKFLLFEAEYRRYKQLVATALEQLESQQDLRLREEVRQLQAKEETQSLAAREPPASKAPPTIVYTSVKNKHGVLQNPTGWCDGRRVWGGGIVKYRIGSDQLLPWPIDSLHSTTGDLSSTGSERRGKVTVAAAGGQLTAIQSPSLGEGEGNVHSGATPPWLKEDESDASKGEGGALVTIGPSEEVFLRHREQGVRTKGKNPRRVGADFQLQLRSEQTPSTCSKEWFPSFGRVWNSGPRSHSLAEFHSESATRPAAIINRSHLQRHSSSSTFTQSELPGPSGISSPTADESEAFSRGSVGDCGRDVGKGLEGSGLVVRPYVRKRQGRSGRGV